MRTFRKSLFLIALLFTCFAVRAETFSGTAFFLDTTNPVSGFTGTFSNPTFTFSDTGSPYINALTITPPSADAMDTVGILIQFTDPEPQGAVISGTGTISGSSTPNGSIIWDNNGMSTFIFASGTQVIASIPNFTFNGTDPVTQNLTFTAIAPAPEPSAIALTGTGLLAIAGAARRKWGSLAS